jgi:hypothetical protein
MTTYSREYLKGLKKEADLKQYNEQMNIVVSTISKAILFSATKGSIELTLKIKIIPPPKKGESMGGLTLNWGPDTVVVYDIEMIHQVIDKLKIQFFDSHIEYIESKDLSGNVLTSAIRINWDEITLDNIESRTQKEIQDENVKNGLARCANEKKDKSIEKWKNNYIEQQNKKIQDENVKNGLERRKRIVEETSNKIKELEEQIAIKRDLIKKLTGLY